MGRPARPRTVPTPVPGLGRVAVLDDDAECLDLARLALSSAGFEVETFSGPEPLFARLESALPDALVLDRRFPGGSGEMLSCKLRAVLGRQRPPVVLWTADPSREVEKVLLCGLANDMVVKCVQGVDVLVQRVINVLGWEYVGPGLMLKAKEGWVLYGGERSKPLTGREIDFLLQLGMSMGEGVSRGQGHLLLLDPDDDGPADLRVNRVVSRLLKKLPRALRKRFKTIRGKGWKLRL